MLGYLFEKATALVSSTVDGVVAIGEYAVDEVVSIPDSIAKGWDEGILGSEEVTDNDGEATACNGHATPPVAEKPRFGNA